jgi:hypothetical protein
MAQKSFPVIYREIFTYFGHDKEITKMEVSVKEDISRMVQKLEENRSKKDEGKNKFGEVKKVDAADAKKAEENLRKNKMPWLYINDAFRMAVYVPTP